MTHLSIIPVEGIGEIATGDDLAGMIAGAAELVDGDVVVVTQKIVSKAEGMLEAVARPLRNVRRFSDLPPTTATPRSSMMLPS